MKMKLEDNLLIVASVDNTQYQMIKSWNLMKWNRTNQWLEGTVSMELLDKLAGIVALPQPIAEKRRQMHRLQDAVNAERMREEPVPLYKYPVKKKLFRHQIRGANMALITFGLIEPEEVPEPEKPKAENVEESLNKLWAYWNGDEHAFDKKGE